MKLIDFGLAHGIKSNSANEYRKCLGTYGYMAPEVHQSHIYDISDADRFSLAVILFIMKSGHPPFNKAHKSDPYYKLFMKKPKKFWRFHAKSKPKGYYSEEYMDLLTKMFSYDPKNRLTLDEIMASDYMKGETYEKKDVEAAFKSRHSKMVQ